MARRDEERLERQRGTSQPSGKRELIVSKTWLQLTLLVFVVGFFVLGLLAYRTYQSDPPIPERSVDPSGATVYTGDDVQEGQKVFLDNGLMEYGSVFGHGAYLGPDYTADYLRRSSDSVRNQLGGDQSDSARQQTISQFQDNRYEADTGTLPLSAEQARAFGELRAHYGRFFGDPTTRFGLRPDAITRETDLDMRLVRYRARARVCNSCRLKDACTDSDSGREIARALDSWPHSEAGRFHRGIALAMVGFALLVIVAGAGLNHAGGDLAVLGAAAFASTAIGLFLLADLRSTPSGFPWREAERSGARPAARELRG